MLTLPLIPTLWIFEGPNKGIITAANIMNFAKDHKILNMCIFRICWSETPGQVGSYSSLKCSSVTEKISKNNGNSKTFRNFSVSPDFCYFLIKMYKKI